jgi:hypothetical protein
MSLAPLDSSGNGSLSDLADGVASRTGAWIVVERFGAVVTHGHGRRACLADVAAALLAKSTQPLRVATTWTGGGRRMRGTLAGTPLTAVDLGGGGTAWFIDADEDSDVTDDVVALLTAALEADLCPATDPLVESLLHPRGPARNRPAPSAVLVAFSSTSPTRLLVRAAVAVAAGTAARVHAEGDAVVVATASEDEARSMIDAVRARCAGTVAGMAIVAEDASDWVTAGRHAFATAAAARRLGLPFAASTSPPIVAELVISEAHEAAAALGRELGSTPLTRLQEYDERSSRSLVATLRTWVATGFDYAATAEAAHVHVNTLRYRIRRASEISGLDLRNPRHVLALQIQLADPAR